MVRPKARAGRAPAPAGCGTGCRPLRRMEQWPRPRPKAGHGGDMTDRTSFPALSALVAAGALLLAAGPFAAPGDSQGPALGPPDHAAAATTRVAAAVFRAI
ncbi:MAG: hypothetical protein ACK559_26935, partial [bacterium]